jgi:hypothetical protein
MMCKHCSHRPDARKFFWSDVDRLANSFAEIPSHVMRCKRCPGEVKNNLASFKLLHPEQMARLPRGSQKVFFRRLWRRLHGSKDTSENDIIEHPEGKVLLCIGEDKDWLSDLDCFVRSNVEVYIANEDDIEHYKHDRKYAIMEGNVGLRCIHCAHLKHQDRSAGACFFPNTISSVYEATREFQKNHLPNCPFLPPGSKEKLNCNSTSSSLTSVLRRYYVLAAKALGMVDTQDGVRAAEGSKLDPNYVPEPVKETITQEDSNTRDSPRLKENTKLPTNVDNIIPATGIKRELEVIEDDDSDTKRNKTEL